MLLINSNIIIKFLMIRNLVDKLEPKSPLKKNYVL